MAVSPHTSGILNTTLGSTAGKEIEDYLNTFIVISSGLSAAELAVLDGVTPGTAVASKALVLGASKEIATITSATITTLTSTTGNITTVNATNVDAGASGTAGTYDVFPSTASKGKASISCTDQSTDTTVSLVVGAMAAARTLTVPDPLASCNFLMGRQAAVAITANADGLTTAIIPDGGLIQHVTVTSGNSGHFVTLPTATPGTKVTLDVGANGFKLRTPDPTTIAINGGTGSNVSSTIAASSTLFMICISATAWKGFFLDGDSDLAKVAAAA